MGNSGTEKKLTILPSETSYLNTLGSLFPILIHWKIYNLSLIHSLRTGYSIAYVNTWGSAGLPLNCPNIYYLKHEKIWEKLDFFKT